MGDHCLWLHPPRPWPTRSIMARRVLSGRDAQAAAAVSMRLRLSLTGAIDFSVMYQRPSLQIVFLLKEDGVLVGQ